MAAELVLEVVAAELVLEVVAAELVHSAVWYESCLDRWGLRYAKQAFV